MSVQGPAVLDYGAFLQPPTPLFRHYVGGLDSVAPFYGHPTWTLARLSAAAEASRPGAARAEVASALVRQQHARGAGRAAALAARLLDPRAVAVVTGQQAGLFGGALYVAYKALAALELASRLEAHAGRPVVPVFWVASDDHDFAEVRSANVLDEAGALRTLRYTPRQEPVGQPAALIEVDDRIAAVRDELAAALVRCPHRDDVVARVDAAYAPGTSFAEAFARLLSSLFPDLVVLVPSDPALKALATPIVEREIREASPSSARARETAERLLSAGYHQQVPVREGFLNLFVYLEGQRRALALADGRVEVRGTDLRLTGEEALDLVRREPSWWSPGVLLRPIVQDHLLPTAAYVGGPAEVAYHAQLGGVYAHFGVPRPLLVPRPSVTLVEPAAARAMEAEGLTFPDLQADPEALLSRWTRDTHPELEEAFRSVRHSLEQEMGAVKERLGALDPTLAAAADSALGRALHPVDALHEKAVRALKKRDQSRGDRLRRTRDALLPGGAFQERGLSAVAVLARHGIALLRDLRAAIDPWARGHQVITL